MPLNDADWSYRPAYRWLVNALDGWSEAHAWTGEGLSLDDVRAGRRERGEWACTGLMTSIQADLYRTDTILPRCRTCAGEVLRAAGVT